MIKGVGMTEAQGMFRGPGTKCYLEKRVLADIENRRVGRPRLSPKLEETVTFTLAAKKTASTGQLNFTAVAPPISHLFRFHSVLTSTCCVCAHLGAKAASGGDAVALMRLNVYENDDQHLL